MTSTADHASTQHHRATGVPAKNPPTKPASLRKQQTKALVGRLMDHGRRLGVELSACQIRNALQILREAGDVKEPTDEQIIETLMKANWRPRKRIAKVA